MHLLVALADAIAEEAHRGQVDKVGIPYIAHPRAVAKALAMEGAAPEVLAVALLHDVLEDTSVIDADLLDRGIPLDVVEDVIALSFRYGGKNETRDEYYVRVKARPRALRVKRADIAHNTDPRRLENLDAAVRDRLVKKYAHALRQLA